MNACIVEVKEKIECLDILAQAIMKRDYSNVQFFKGLIIMYDVFYYKKFGTFGIQARRDIKAFFDIRDDFRLYRFLKYIKYAVIFILTKSFPKIASYYNHELRSKMEKYIETTGSISGISDIVMYDTGFDYRDYPKWFQVVYTHLKDKYFDLFDIFIYSVFSLEA